MDSDSLRKTKLEKLGLHTGTGGSFEINGGYLDGRFIFRNPACRKNNCNNCKLCISLEKEEKQDEWLISKFLRCPEGRQPEATVSMDTIN